MKFLDYEERAPFAAPAARAYHERAVALGANVKGTEHAYGDHPLQRLLVFAAPEPQGEVLLFLHGGRWSHGYKEWNAMMAPPLNKRGVTLVSASYRLCPDHPFPAGLDDCARALQWVHGELPRLGGRSDAVFIGGHSAGGHYASLLALAHGPAASHRLPPVAGCLPVSGVFLFDPDPASPNATSPQAMETLFPAGATAEGCAAASPLRADLRQAPPFHITWGTDDLPSILAQSPLMVSALQDAGADVEQLVLEGLDHFDASCATADDDGAWIQQAERFMRRHRASTS